MKSMLVCKSFHLEFPKAILWVVGSRTFKPLCRQNKLLLAIIHLHSQILFFVTNFLFNIFTIRWYVYWYYFVKNPRYNTLGNSDSVHNKVYILRAFCSDGNDLHSPKTMTKTKRETKTKTTTKRLKQRQSQRQMKITLRPFWSLPSGMTCTRLALKWPFRANFK